MKKILLCFTFALLPVAASSADYSLRVTDASVEERLGDRVFSKPRSSLSMRIERFARKHGAPASQAALMAELLSCKPHAKLMAAVAARESGFDVSARGAAGEVGCYQVIPSNWGHPGNTFPAQTEKTDRILQELLDASGGKVDVATAKYNGGSNWRGPQAQDYAKAIRKLVRSV